MKDINKLINLIKLQDEGVNDLSSFICVFNINVTLWDLSITQT